VLVGKTVAINKVGDALLRPALSAKSAWCSAFLHGSNIDLRGKGAVHRAFVGNLQKPFALLLVEITCQSDGTIDTIEHPFLRLAVLAIDGMDSGVHKTHRDPIAKFVFRSALRPNQISFSHSQDPMRL
jgi:hypothetical protein